MLENYKFQTPFAFFTVKIKQQKQFVIKSKPDFNRKIKNMHYDENYHGFDADGIPQGIFVLDGIRQADEFVSC